MADLDATMNNAPRNYSFFPPALVLELQYVWEFYKKNFTTLLFATLAVLVCRVITIDFCLGIGLFFFLKVLTALTNPTNSVFVKWFGTVFKSSTQAGIMFWVGIGYGCLRLFLDTHVKMSLNQIHILDLVLQQIMLLICLFVHTYNTSFPISCKAAFDFVKRNALQALSLFSLGVLAFSGFSFLNGIGSLLTFPIFMVMLLRQWQQFSRATANAVQNAYPSSQP